ncbi:MAG: PAS domain S-box protein [Deltaproteobacteria bacterium]|nr:PAS domain S-box protein [Deltaproteobacteria bacterium]
MTASPQMDRTPDLAAAIQRISGIAFPDLPQDICRAAVEDLSFLRCSLVIPDPDNRQVTLFYCFPLPLEEEPFPPPHEALEHRYLDWTAREFSPVLRQNRLCEAAVFPLIAGDEIIGALELELPGLQILSDQDMVLTTAFASFSAIKLKNHFLTRQIEELSAQFETMFDEANDAIFLQSFEGDILYTNRMAQELLGYTENELSSLKLIDILPAALARQLPDLQDQLTNSGSFFGESVYVHKDGSHIPVEVSARVVEVQEQRCILSFVRDIVERKFLEDVLIERAKRANVIKRFAVRAVSTLNYEDFLKRLVEVVREIFRADRAFMDFPFDPQASEFKAHYISSVPRFAPRQPKKSARSFRIAPFAPIMRRALNAEGPISVVFPDPLLDDDIFRKLQIQSTLHVVLRPNNSDAPWGLTLVQCEYPRIWVKEEMSLLEEIGLLATLALQNVLLYRDLEEKNRELDAFVYTVSHDLKTPVVSAGGFANLIKRRYTGRMEAKDLAILDRIIGSMARMEAMIGGLLQLSRANRRLEELEDVDVRKLIYEVLNDLSPLIEENWAQVKVLDDYPVLKMEKTKLYQVFQNLIGNSLKYCDVKRNPEIIITCRELDSEYILAVSDNGRGIPREYQEHIFNVFDRSGAPEGITGTGVGLAIVKKIIESWKGRVWLESEPGAGATFYFSIPISARADKKS